MNKQYFKQTIIGGIVLLCIVVAFGSIVSTRNEQPPPQMAADSTRPKPPEPATPLSAGQPIASAAANASHGVWRIIKNKNPITGVISMYALTESTKKIYNPFVPGEFEKVSLVVECPALDQPFVMLWTKEILTPDAADVYQGSIRIDDQVVPVGWRIGGTNKDIMTAIPNGVVQKLQTGKSVIVSFRSLKAGEQFPVFNLTGIKTTMNKMDCPNLTRE